MLKEILLAILKYIIPILLGYCLNSLKNYSKREKLFKKSLMTLLQSNLTNTYFAYDNMKTIPDYVYQNWLNELKVYEELGGNSYIHSIAKKIENWEIVRTDILQNK